MLVYFEPPPERLRGFRVGPLGPHIESFASLISQQGYSPAAGWTKLYLVAGLSRWLERRHVRLEDFDEHHVSAFLQERWGRVSKRRGKGTLLTLLRHLRESQVIQDGKPGRLSEPSNIEEQYGRFLVDARGLMESSLQLYLRVARSFVSSQLKQGKLRLDTLTAEHVTDFVLRSTSQRGRWSTKSIITGLRSFLGFLFQAGRIKTNLAAAVPSVSVPYGAGLPRFLQPEQVEKTLRCCDRRTNMGKRDYVILLLLARLGLRRGEVVRLTLDDINWDAGELLIHGKGARLDKLPLLQDVGEALADYLQKARPSSSSRHVFTLSRAPYAKPLAAPTISCMVAHRLARAQIHSPHTGAHVLRHSLATGMLRHGATLAEIGQVLRHQSLRTTEIYAKVDLIALRPLALPWQGGEL
jgi:site-specific recombinase XerD